MSFDYLRENATIERCSDRWLDAPEHHEQCGNCFKDTEYCRCLTCTYCGGIDDKPGTCYEDCVWDNEIDEMLLTKIPGDK